MAYQRQCPRCRKQVIPRDENPGEYPGAMSRITVDGRRIIEICSICGEDEGFEAMTKGGYTPVGNWPISDWLDITKQMEASVRQFKELQARGAID